MPGTGNVGLHGMVTCDHADDLTREKIMTIILKCIDVEKAIVCEEFGEQKQDKCKCCETGRNHHFHCVFKGRFIRKNMGKRLQMVRGEGKHLNLTWKHVWAVNDKPVIAGLKTAGETKAPWNYNDMVTYVLDPMKDKETDPTPYYYRCDETSVYDIVQTDFAEACKDVQTRKRKGQSLDHVMEEVMRPCSYDTDTHKFDVGKYRYLRDLYDNTPLTNTIAFLPEHFELKDFQRAFLGWTPGPVKEGDGLWVNLRPGLGKTTMLKLMYLLYGTDEIYIPRSRPDKGGYDVNSFLTYKNQKYVIFNDLTPHIDDNEKPHWKGGLIDVLKKLTDGFPIAMNFGGKDTFITPVCKVIVMSNYFPPRDPAIMRRYIPLDEDFITKYADQYSGPTTIDYDKLPKWTDLVYSLA